jgi:hypothetical protein
MNLNLTINLPAIAVCSGLTRQEAYKGPYRERISEEKYFRQAIQIYCKEGEPEDSGFIQLNDYTDMCKMIRVLPKHNQCLHAFDCWEHYEASFFKTEKFNIRDLMTGNFVEERFEVPAGMPYNDLEKNEDYLYSKVLLETLEEYSESNMPELVLQNRKKFAEISKQRTCYECNLFECLDIEDAFTEDRINEEDKNKLLIDLTCNCEVETFAPEPTESELMQRAVFKVKARAEIAEMFIVKALAKTKTLLETKLSESYSGLAVISEENIHALKQVFIKKQKAQDGPEIEKAFIEKEVEQLTREILKRV